MLLFPSRSNSATVIMGNCIDALLKIWQLHWQLLRLRGLANCQFQVIAPSPNTLWRFHNWGNMSQHWTDRKWCFEFWSDGGVSYHWIYNNKPTFFPHLLLLWTQCKANYIKTKKGKTKKKFNSSSFSVTFRRGTLSMSWKITSMYNH